MLGHRDAILGEFSKNKGIPVQHGNLGIALHSLELLKTKILSTYS
jgi:hypothetical protein